MATGLVSIRELRVARESFEDAYAAVDDAIIKLVQARGHIRAGNSRLNRLPPDDPGTLACLPRIPKAA